MMRVVATPAEMHGLSRELHAAGKRLALVPTMGALHEGHLTLVDRSRRAADVVLVSVFVNPTQFGPNEDFTKYPRDIEGDLAKLEARGVDVVFTPTRDAMYPAGFDTFIVPGAMAGGLCGASRPGHFRGVCTVVYLLFHITGCHVAVFGEKDFQQLQVIRRMTQDLRIEVEILGAPIYRDPDGLAASSRNAYLSPNERQRALSISRGLREMAEAHAAGARAVNALLGVVRRRLEEAQLEPEYVAMVHESTLEPVQGTLTGPAVCAVAARVGGTRLIDNCRVPGAKG